MSSSRMYFDLGSSPERRNFIWGNICLERERGEHGDIDRAREAGRGRDRQGRERHTPIKVSFVTKCVNRRGV